MKKLIFASIIVFLILSGCTQQVVDNEKKVEHTVNLVEGRYNVAFLVMDGTFNTEFTAP